MILATTISAERGKEITKTANEWIQAEFGDINRKNIATIKAYPVYCNFKYKIYLDITMNGKTTSIQLSEEYTSK
jgi:hypothetical protein